MRFSFNSRVVYTIFSAIFIVLGTIIAIQYAKGNIRLTKKGRIVQDSGLLAANSFPPGAEIAIDGKLASATDDTLYLSPGEYQVEISKDGYWPWQKTLKIERELVTQTNATLFPQAPILTPLTFTGVSQVLPSPDGEKILFYTSSASAKTKNGLYVLELTSNVIPFNRQARQILSDQNSLIDFNQNEYIWSPDSSQIYLHNPIKDVLVEVDKKTDISQLPNISRQTTEILSLWEEEMYLRERQFLAKFPDEIIKIATSEAHDVYISPDKKRLMYTATANNTLPEDLVPPVPATNTQVETRTLKPDKIYLYDREEDKNFLVQDEADNLTNKFLLAIDLFEKQPLDYDASPSAFTKLQEDNFTDTTANFNRYYSSLYSHGLQWFTDSKHLIYTQNSNILIKEYDNANQTKLYSGPFENDFIFPWPDGSKIVIIASFSPDSQPNLYAIELK